jgi:hypothetical protein
MKRRNQIVSRAFLVLALTGAFMSLPSPAQARALLPCDDNHFVDDCSNVPDEYVQLCASCNRPVVCTTVSGPGVESCGFDS